MLFFLCVVFDSWRRLWPRVFLLPLLTFAAVTVVVADFWLLPFRIPAPSCSDDPPPTLEGRQPSVTKIISTLWPDHRVQTFTTRKPVASTAAS